VPFHKPPVILGRVDAEGGFVDDPDEDRVAGVEESEPFRLNLAEVAQFGENPTDFRPICGRIST
jgi:hypothetical protein